MTTPFHPELRKIARWLPRNPVSRWTYKLLRALPAPQRRLPPGISVVERRLHGPQPVTVRVLSGPPGGAPRPAILWIHGGGYVIGRAAQDDWLCAFLVERLGAVVVSVEYRLAPEHPFPTPLDDCLAAYDFLHREAAGLGIDPARVAIAGQSAGGGLAAALVLRIHDLQRPAPALQALVYPMLDDRTALRPDDGAAHRLWSYASNRFGWASYLGRTPGAPEVPAHAAPARRERMAGLPPAWIGVGTHDLFYDEDRAYAERLRAAGVSVTLDIVEGAFHGFDAIAPKAPVSQRFRETLAAAIARAVGVEATPAR